MQTIEKTVQHCWKPMEEYKHLSLDSTFEDIEDSIENPSKVDIDSLQKMKPNQFYLIKGCNLNSSINETNLMNTTKFQRYIEFLRGKGFDIGNDANSQYGYKMPLPKKEDATRELIIFRRY